jgi:hypothetical protein
MVNQTPIRISILHSSFNRPKKSVVNAENWASMAERPEQVEWLVGMDSIDESIPQYYFEYGNSSIVSKFGRFEINIGKSTNVIQAVNRIATTISDTSELLITMSEDMYCLPKWDTILLNLLNGTDNFKQPKFILVSEGHYYSPDRLSEPWNDEYGYYIANRAFYKKLGYVIWHEYTHYGADTDIFAVAKILNVIIDARHILIKHDYYQQNASHYDETHSRKNIDKEWKTSFQVLSERKSRNFDLNQGEIE